LKTALVIGAGAGGAAVAKTLQGSFKVTVLEHGRNFKPFGVNLNWVEKTRKLGLWKREWLIPWLFPAMRIQKTKAGMVLVWGRCTGGTTTLAAGNGVRHDARLRALGINLDVEFRELAEELPITDAHEKFWTPLTKRAFEFSRQKGWKPMNTPKLLRLEKCRHCGHCILGCPYGAKWESREYLHRVWVQGGEVKTGRKVVEIEADKNRVRVLARHGVRTETYTADVCVVAAGGFGTPVILKNSGVAMQKRLFVDPVLCVAARVPNANQLREIPMPFVVQRGKYILSPYFDYLSFFFNSKWNYPRRDIYSLMIKLADQEQGDVRGGRIDKPLTLEDKKALDRGVADCLEIFRELGIDTKQTFLGTLNAGHPGGMLPLTEASAASMHPTGLPENVYVADASLFPGSLGNPPILTIMALAKKIGKTIIDLPAKN
jgi:choline dehydrogenase-like flavoprotein